MERKHNQSTRLRIFWKAIGMSPLQILLTVLFWTALACLIFFVYFAFVRVPPERAISSTKSTAETEIDDQLSALMESKFDSSVNFQRTIMQLQDLETKLAEIEESNSLTPEQAATATWLRINSRSVKVALLIKNEGNYKAEKADLIRLCEAHVDDKTKGVRQLSRKSLCYLSTLEFAQSPSPETYQNFADTITAYEDCYLDLPKQAKALELTILEVVDSPDRPDLATQGIELLSKQLQKSKIESVRASGIRFGSFGDFGRFKLSTLAQRIAWDKPSSSADLNAAIEVLRQKPDTGNFIWLVLIHAQESFLANGQIDNFVAAWRKLSDISQAIPNEESRREVQLKLERQKQRVALIGKQFDLAGTDLIEEGKPIEFGNGQHTAIILIDGSKESYQLQKRIFQFGDLKRIDFRAVVALRQPLDSKDLEAIKNHRSENLVFASANTVNEYIEGMLVDWLPYIVLVDDSGKIVAANLPFDQVPSRVRKLQNDKLKLERARQEPVGQ